MVVINGNGINGCSHGIVILQALKVVGGGVLQCKISGFNPTCVILLGLTLV